MRVINVHNRHAHPGGMEVFFESMNRVLRDHGDEVIAVERDNKDIHGLAGKLAAFGSMVYSPSAKRAMATLLADKRPDIVHLQNIYPQFSPSIIDACRDANVPVVMSVHDYKLTCPTAQHLRDGKICEKCMGGHEQWCAIHNCRGSRAMSVAYAVRNASARISRKIHDGVDAFLCVSQFVANLTIRGGFPAERVKVVHNFVDLPPAPPRTGEGHYVAYIGRISPEKGIDVLIDAARRTGRPVKIAGDWSQMPELKRDLPHNVEFLGPLRRDQIPAFLLGARIIIVPSKWYEAFGLVCVEAMAYRLPVIASRIGGIPEVVRDGVDGLCIEPGNAIALGDAIENVWNDAGRARAMGESGYGRTQNEFSPGSFYERLMSAYRDVISSREQSPRDDSLAPVPGDEGGGEGVGARQFQVTREAQARIPSP